MRSKYSPLLFLRDQTGRFNGLFCCSLVCANGLANQANWYSLKARESWSMRMKYTKPDIILQSVTRLEEQNAWEIKMRVIFRNIGSHILTLPIPMEKILDGGVRHTLTMSEAADEAQRIIITDLLATAALNADWLDENVRAAIYNAFPNARP
ncbi:MULTISPECIES: hypothetical protein [Brucella]